MYTDSTTKDYTLLQHSKFQFLYMLYVWKSEGAGDQEGFFEYVNKFLEDKGEVKEDQTEPRIHFAENVGLRFGFSLIKELQTVSPNLLVSALKHLYESLCEQPAGRLYGTDVLAFEQDSTFDYARDFLVSIINDFSSKSKEPVEIAMKIIIRLGIIRSNVEDFLIAAKILSANSELGAQIDLRSEIKALPVVG